MNSEGSLAGDEEPEFGVEGRSNPDSSLNQQGKLRNFFMYHSCLRRFWIFRWGSEDAASPRSKEPYGLLSSSFHILADSLVVTELRIQLAEVNIV